MIRSSSGGAHADDPGRTIDILDFPAIIAEHYGVHHVEIQHTHFRSTEPDYLEEFGNRLKKAQSQMTQLVLELGKLNISSPDPVLRVETIDLTKRWIDHAVTLGCPRVMVNQGTLAPEVRQTAIDTLKKINAYAKTRKVWVTMENRDDPPGEGGRAAAGAAPADWHDEYEVIKASRDLGQSRPRWIPRRTGAVGGIAGAVSVVVRQQPFTVQPETVERGQGDPDFEGGRIQRAVFDRSRTGS